MMSENNNLRRKRLDAARGWGFAMALLLGLCGCAGLPHDFVGPEAPQALAAEREINLWPLFYHRSQPGRVNSVTEVLWPFLEWRNDVEQSGFFFRPFYNRQNLKETKRVETEFVYPFGFGTFTKERRQRWFWPIWRAGTESADGGHNRVFELLPFMIWNCNQNKPNDFMLFPFYANLHNRNKRDRIVFILWPIYTEERKGSDHAWTWLFPFFRYECRPDGAGFKFWPFYGHAWRDGKESKTFVLWPFYNRQEAVLKQGGKWESLLLFPFWGQERSPAGTAWTAAMVFCHSVRYAGNESAWNMPWPFIGWTTGEGKLKHRLWPLYTYSRERTTPGTQSDAKAGEATREKEQLVVLWPIIWRTKANDADGISDAFRIVPLFWLQKDTASPRDKRDGSFFQLWPLFKAARERDGSGEAEFPSILPLRKRPGFKRNYAPFFRIFEWERAADGDEHWSVLWRFLRMEREGAVTRFDFWPLLSWRRLEAARANETNWSLLRGLIGYERDRSECTARVLWFLSLTWGTAPDIAVAEAMP